MEAVLMTILIILLIVLLVVLLGRPKKDGVQTSELLKQLTDFRQQITDQMLNSNKAISERLGESTQVISQVQQNLGKLAVETDRIREIGKDMSNLQNILQPPKLRGILGETLLENLLSQCLPAESFMMPYQFSSTQVDAVIRLPTGLVPVDAKFPLDNFRKMMESAEKKDKQQWRREFAKDVRKHIDDIASKYILPDEGTLNFALMYIPAENVYYEIMVKDESGEGLVDYALSKRVCPVSPSTFWAYFQAIAIGLKGLRVEKYAGEILENLTSLRGDIDNFYGHFETLGKHLSHARDKYDEAERSRQHFDLKFSNIEKYEIVEELPKEVEKTSLPAPAKNKKKG